jgi:hypothetical protein
MPTFKSIIKRLTKLLLRGDKGKIPKITITPPSPDGSEYGDLRLEDLIAEKHGDFIILRDPSEMRRARTKETIAPDSQLKVPILPKKQGTRR